MPSLFLGHAEIVINIFKLPLKSLLLVRSVLRYKRHVLEGTPTLDSECIQTWMLGYGVDLETYSCDFKVTSFLIRDLVTLNEVHDSEYCKTFATFAL